MPKVRPLTAEQREEARKTRTLAIIRACAAFSGLSRAEIAARASLTYSAYNRRLRGDIDFTAYELAAVADALNLDDETRAALLGGRKCGVER